MGQRKLRLRGEYSTNPQASIPSSQVANICPLNQAVIPHPGHPVKPFFALSRLQGYPSAIQPKVMSSIFSSHYPGITIQSPKPPVEATGFSLQHLGEANDNPTLSELPTVSSVTKKSCLAAGDGMPLQDPASNPKVYAQGATDAVAAKGKGASLNESQAASQNPFTHALTKSSSSLKTKPTPTTSARSQQIYSNVFDTSSTMGSRKDTKMPKLDTYSMTATSDRPQIITETAKQNQTLPAKRYSSIQVKAPTSNSSVEAVTQVVPRNPFLQAHRSFEGVESQPILVSSKKGELEKHCAHTRTLQRSLKHPNPLVAKILTSHPRFKSEVGKITKTFDVSLDTVDNNGSTMCYGSTEYLSKTPCAHQVN